MIGAWVSGQVTVAEVKAWGEGPRGRLYMLEEDVKKHHTDTTKEMENKIQADHDMLVALEGKIQRLTEVTDTQNKLYFELLKELRSRQR
jgi:predicted choloylglycine hydrolase